MRNNSLAQVSPATAGITIRAFVCPNFFGPNFVCPNFWVPILFVRIFSPQFFVTIVLTQVSPATAGTTSGVFGLGSKFR